MNSIVSHNSTNWAVEFNIYTASITWRGPWEIVVIKPRDDCYHIRHMNFALLFLSIKILITKPS
jgi:hypothetical protein